LSFLDVKGYIAGVTNPVFENNQDWWDLCCDIDKSKITINPKIIEAEKKQAELEQKSKKELEPHAILDTEFFNDINAGIQSHFGDTRIQNMFRDFTQHIIDIAFDEEEFPTDAIKKRESDSNVKRIEEWKRTPSYLIYCDDRNKRLNARYIKEVDIQKHLRRLRIRKDLSEQETISIYKDFVRTINTQEQLTEFLSYLPESHGGLYPVAVSLFHPSEAVRLATVELFRRLDRIKTGSGFITNLNFFLLLAYERNSRRLKEK